MIPRLEVTAARVRYGRGSDAIDALQGVDLRIEPGEIVGLIGRNGAGKSTLMSAIAGLVRLDAGQVRIDGEPQDGSLRQKRRVGLAPQDEGIYPTLTVRENLELFTRLAGVERSSRRSVVNGVADDLLLGDLLDRRAGDLSGGQRRRVHTGIALVHAPSLLLLDEPTAGVDVETREAVLSSVQRAADRGAAVLYSTHHLAELDRLECRVAVMHEGTVIADDAIPSLLARFTSSSVEIEFDGTIPTWDYGPASAIESTDGRVRVIIDDPAAHVAPIAASAGATGARVVGVRIVEADLHAVYLRLVGQPPESHAE